MEKDEVYFKVGDEVWRKEGYFTREVPSKALREKR